MWRRCALILACCVLVAGCAAGPAYRAAEQPDDYGYRDTRLTREHFRVSFAGGYGTARETVENFALFRAADVALASGASRFRISSRQTSPITSDGAGVRTTVGYGWGYPFWGTGIGYSTGGPPRTRYETVLDIQVGADVPASGPDVYDAGEVKHNLSPVVAAGRD